MSARRRTKSDAPSSSSRSLASGLTTPWDPPQRCRCPTVQHIFSGLGPAAWLRPLRLLPRSVCHTAVPIQLLFYAYVFVSRLPSPSSHAPFSLFLPRRGTCHFFCAMCVLVHLVPWVDALLSPQFKTVVDPPVVAQESHVTWNCWFLHAHLRALPDVCVGALGLCRNLSTLDWLHRPAEPIACT